MRPDGVIDLPVQVDPGSVWLVAAIAAAGAIGVLACTLWERYRRRGE